MTGKSHVACSASSAVMIGSSLRLVEKKYNLICNDNVVSFIQNAAYPYLSGYHQMLYIIWWVLAGIAFILGTLLPDCDNENSMLGKVIHLPFEHRTWTHTFWFLIPFLVGAFFHPLFFYAGAGYFFHLFFDALSRGGVCWFYPISEYRSYGGGAKVKKKHWCKLYSVGKMSEGVVAAVVVMIGIGMLIACVVWGEIV